LRISRPAAVSPPPSRPLRTAGSAQWTGFYRLEYGLWHGQSARELTPIANALAADARGLRAASPSMQIDLIDMGLRTHEILENALQFQLTGIADYGSGTALATLSANLHGTQVVLSTLVGLMQTRDPQDLTTINTWIKTLAVDLNAAHHPDGTWLSLQQLSVAARQKINGDLGQLLEKLAVVPNLLEERTNA